MRDLLVDKGFRLGENLQWIEEEGARHNEAAWGKRFQRALPFLLAATPKGERRRGDRRRDGADATDATGA
jgi:hypothetical protein